MGRTIIFCMFFFCATVVLSAASRQTAKYKQLYKTIERLQTTVKDKDAEWLHTPENPVDECLFTAVTCFQNGTLKLQPKNSQVKPTFNLYIRVLKGFPFSNPGEHCESSCESYEKKSPIEFLESFEKLITQVIR
ncbi:IL21 protein, partial [Aegotheles bennettii]|nr:IL21 protein [Aegotheles bennettii]